ncbi:uncharacterized protein [Macrobrachium rosenbergii]
MLLMMWILTQFLSTEATVTEMLRKGSSVVGMSLKTANVNYIHPVKSQCGCWRVCAAMPKCTSASVSEDSLKCNVSYWSFTWDNLVPSSGSAVTYFWPPEYDLCGKRYYKVYAPTDYFSAKKKCLGEMGQLAILDTPEKFGEVTKYLEMEGLNFGWIGLYVSDPSGSQPPVWQYREANVSSTGILWSSMSSCFNVNRYSAPWALNNNARSDYNCYMSIQPVCQRDF